MLCHILLDTCIVKAIRNVVLARTVECHPAIAGYKECGRIRSTRNNPRAYKEGKGLEEEEEEEEEAGPSS